MFKKIVAALMVVAVAVVGGLLLLFHSRHRDWQNIHPNLVYKTQKYRQQAWYIPVAKLLNLPRPGHSLDGKNEGVGGAGVPDEELLKRGLKVKMVTGGFYYLEAFKKYTPGAVIEFSNDSKDKTVDTLFQIQFYFPNGGAKLYSTRKFVNLKPGRKFQERFMGDREEYSFARPADEAEVKVRVSIPGEFVREFTIPRRLLRQG